MARRAEPLAADTVWAVRPEEPRDVPAVEAVVTAAFGGPGVAALLSDMRGDHCWRGLSFVVSPTAEPDAVVGHVSYTRGWVDSPDELVEVLVLSPMSVHPRWQRQGAGTTLIHRSLAELGGRPEPFVFLEGSPHFYARAGFEPAAENGFTRPSTRIPEKAFQLWRLDGGARAAALTGALVYPDVFWRHDAVGLR
jgi:putative acetyltransferase